MSQLTLDISDFHWVMQIIDTMDSGLVVIDNKNYDVCVWNSFMQSYSGIPAQSIMGKNLFTACPELPEAWLTAKIEISAGLETQSFSSWEDRPHVFNFKNFSPISQGLNQMYQNLVITPLKSLTSTTTHTAIMVHDVSDIALNKIHLRETNQHLSYISRTDGLTHLFNRAHWETCLKEVFDSCKVTGEPASLVMFDIDHFKKVNDTYGHGVGDDVIREVSSLLRRSSRKTDYCGRYGGEEFTALLPGTTEDQAYYFAERLRKKVESTLVKSGNVDVKFTISLGVCEFRPEFNDYLEWLTETDKSLYESKQNGRNQVTINKVTVSHE